MILTEAAKRAGGFKDKAKLRDQIEKTKGFIGTGGVVNMSPTDHVGLDQSAFRMLRLRTATGCSFPNPVREAQPAEARRRFDRRRVSDHGNAQAKRIR